MDIITFIWYLSTFLALAAFFFLMACSDRKCGRTNIQNEQLISLQPPPTPAPSYSEFAPPSYESVIKNTNNHHIYVIPINNQIKIEDNNNNNSNSKEMTTLSPIIKITEISSSIQLSPTSIIETSPAITTTTTTNVPQANVTVNVALHDANQTQKFPR